MSEKPDTNTTSGDPSDCERQVVLSDLPSPIEALKFRQDQYCFKQFEMAALLGMAATHYSEVLRGRRRLSLTQIRRAVAIGVPAEVILQPFPCEAESERKRTEKLEREVKSAERRAELLKTLL